MQNRPTWLPAHAMPDLTTDPLHSSWLHERGSLTVRLRDTWGAVSVEVIEEGLSTPLSHEADRLDLAEGESAWVRCVLLVAQDRPRVYARSVIPHWSDRNPWADVQRLGQQPLGELLFRLPELERSGFEWAQGLVWPHSHHWTAGVSAAWARRCVFTRHRAPLLLTEVFLEVVRS